LLFFYVGYSCDGKAEFHCFQSTHDPPEIILILTLFYTIFTVTFDQFNAFLLNKSINFSSFFNILTTNF